MGVDSIEGTLGVDSIEGTSGVDSVEGTSGVDSVEGTLDADSIEAPCAFIGLLNVTVSPTTAPGAVLGVGVGVIIVATGAISVVVVAGLDILGAVVTGSTTAAAAAAATAPTTGVPLAPPLSSFSFSFDISPAAIFPPLLPCVRSSVRTSDDTAAIASSFLILSSLSSVLPNTRCLMAY
jgi:hypothetical protein